MAKASAEPQLVVAIRAAIKASELSLNELGRRAGIDSTQMSRFTRGERGLGLVAGGRLAEVLGLVLQPAVAKKARVEPGK